MTSVSSGTVMGSLYLKAPSVKYGLFSARSLSYSLQTGRATSVFLAFGLERASPTSRLSLLHLLKNLRNFKLTALPGQMAALQRCMPLYVVPIQLPGHFSETPSSLMGFMVVTSVIKEVGDLIHMLVLSHVFVLKLSISTMP
ncbi:unnamed protein product [Arctogadus glacialis]